MRRDSNPRAPWLSYLIGQPRPQEECQEKARLRAELKEAMATVLDLSNRQIELVHAEQFEELEFLVVGYFRLFAFLLGARANALAAVLLFVLAVGVKQVVLAGASLAKPSAGSVQSIKVAC